MFIIKDRKQQLFVLYLFYQFNKQVQQQLAHLQFFQLQVMQFFKHLLLLVFEHHQSMQEQ
jgi:hypothetical protein